MAAIVSKYPYMARGPLIEVPASLNGRPGYRWVQGWVIHYGPHRQSVPVKFNEARNMLNEAKRQQ